MNQKKAKKSEIDKTCAMLRQTIEKRLMDCNNCADLKSIMPNFIFKL